MYCLSDKQIDFILSDISARGVEMESLQQNLLDHVCCIIEQNLDDQGDFEDFYQKTIRRFYKNELWEIEEETLSLLIFKNYYTMKKIMLTSGIFSAFAVTFGIIFKFMHWPGASMFLVLGIGVTSLVFLPLLYVLKIKEKQSTRDKIIIGLGSLAAISLSLGILFKMMHWPFATILGLSTVLIMFFVFLPIYFFTGIRNPETKVNTIISSILLVIGCGLFMALARAPKASLIMDARTTYDYLRSQEILETENQLVALLEKKDTLHSATRLTAQKISLVCEDLKQFILEVETGVKKLDESFEGKGYYLSEHTLGYNPFENDPACSRKYQSLIDLLNEYNSTVKTTSATLKEISTKSTFTDFIRRGYFYLLSPSSVLNELTQIQMVVLQNEQKLFALK